MGKGFSFVGNQFRICTETSHFYRDLAFKKILEEVMSQQRRQELELYKLYAKDDGFKHAFFNTMLRMTESAGKSAVKE